MLLDITISQELQFLFYLAPISIGVQLSIYFFLQYYKLRDKNLYLNRILLSYGMLSLLIIVGTFFINNARLFQTDPLIKTLFSKMGWSFAIASPIAFLIFIANKNFTQILNVKISRTLMVLNLFPILGNFFLSNDSIIFRVSLAFMVMSILYIFYLQFNLIKKTVGSIKMRFSRFLIGEITAIIALVFAVQVGLGILPPGINELFYFIGIAVLSTGFIILFASAYNFPPLYEFNYRENLIKLFIVNRINNACLYFCDFESALKNHDYFINKGSIQNTKDVLFSGGIAGIETIMSILTDTTEEEVNQINQENSVILLERGVHPTFITYVLLVKKDLKSFNHLLKTIRIQFETFFKDILVSLDSLKEDQDKLFRSFDVLIANILR